MTSPLADTRRQTRIAVAGSATLLLVVLVLGRSNRISQDLLNDRALTARQLADDLAAVEALRAEPLVARDFGLPESDLLARIDNAMTTAGISPARLISSVPKAPRRLGQTEVMEIAQRLTFREVELEALSRFYLAIISQDRGLAVSSLRLQSSRSERSFDLDVTITQLAISRR